MVKEIDLLLYGGNIITMDQKNSINDWIAIREGRIFDTGVGNEYEKYLKDSVETIYLDGKTVVPGFYDSHVHLIQTGLNTMELDAGDAGSIYELLGIISEKASKVPSGEMIHVVKFDVSKLSEKRLPTRYELDECAPDNPVWINSSDYHMSIINSLAFQVLKVPFFIEGIQRNEDNFPNGCLTGKASAMVRHRILDNISEKKRLEAANKTISMAMKNGITSLNAMEGGFTFHNKDAELVMKNRDMFAIDVVLFYQTINVNKAVDNGLGRIGGGIFLDGTINSRTAAMYESYNDCPQKLGNLYYEQEEIDDFIKKTAENKLQVSVHAIGPRAIDQILKSYVELNESRKDNETRNRIEHFVYPTDEQIKKCAEFGIILSMMPNYESLWGGKGGMYEKRLGETGKQHTNPIKKAIDKGIVVIGGSDCDITPISPLLGIHSAVNSCDVKVLDALKMYTINGAYGVFEENEKGSLEAGKKGDLVVLDENLLEIDKNRIKDIRVLMTVKEGNILYLGQV